MSGSAVASQPKSMLVLRTIPLLELNHIWVERKARELDDDEGDGNDDDAVPVHPMIMSARGDKVQVCKLEYVADPFRQRVTDRPGGRVGYRRSTYPTQNTAQEKI